MKIKNIVIAFCASLLCNLAVAQEIVAPTLIIANEDSCSTEIIQPAVDAFVLFSESSETKDMESLRKARNKMQECQISPFDSLIPIDHEDNHSLKGHLVFNVIFADSLLSGDNAYKNADKINNEIFEERGQLEIGQILTRTFLIKAKKKSIYEFDSHDRQELAVVAEPGGLITTRIHVINAIANIDEWHNDTTEIAKGKNSRKSAFTLPSTPPSHLTIEITNCTDKDISVVVISN